MITFNKRLVIISPGYNCNSWIPLWYNSLKVQNYTNWVAYAIDDVSDDGTYNSLVNLSKVDNRIKPIHRESKFYHVRNLCDIIHNNCDDDDIIIYLDLDDWFGTKYAFELLIKEVMYRGCLVTSSNTFSLRDYYNHQGKVYVNRSELLSTTIHEYNLFSYQARLFKNIPIDYFIFDNDWMPVCGDTAMTYPILYQAGEKYYKHIFTDNFIIYNNIRDVNDDLAKDTNGTSLHSIYGPKVFDRFHNLVNNNIIHELK